MTDEYGLGVEIDLPFDAAVRRTRVAIRAHGFGILSEMPGPPIVGETVGRQHLFMGVWEGLTAAGNLGGPGLDVGDHLACNFVVFEDSGATFVAVLDPTEGMEGWADLQDTGRRAKEAVESVLEAVLSPLPGE
ncbi:MAG: hypothetical protein KY429_03565 [Actinobacteria bacterium]|nr:hypothetical protein [Actinomycetota bacterium]